MPATINCDPAAISSAGACYCYSDKESRRVITYLLAQIAGDTSTPAALAQKASCYCFDPRTADAVITYLLCEVVNK